MWYFIGCLHKCVIISSVFLSPENNKLMFVERLNKTILCLKACDRLENLTPNAFFFFCLFVLFLFIFFLFLLCFVLFCFRFRFCIFFCFVCVCVCVCFLLILFVFVFVLFCFVLFCFVLSSFFPSAKVSGFEFVTTFVQYEIWNLKEPSPIFLTFFFKLLEILLSQNSSYFSYNSRQISQLKSVPIGRY